MKFTEPNKYTADAGKTFKRNIDDFIMGSILYLYNFVDGNPDTIENYTEVDDPESNN